MRHPASSCSTSGASWPNRYSSTALSVSTITPASPSAICQPRRRERYCGIVCAAINASSASRFVRSLLAAGQPWLTGTRIILVVIAVFARLVVVQDHTQPFLPLQLPHPALEVAQAAVIGARHQQHAV